MRAPAAPVRIAGVDLAAAPERTGWAVLELTALPSPDGRGASGRLAAAGRGLDDGALLDLLASAALTGVDVPVGWPAPFRALLDGAREPDGDALGAGGPAWRREMTLRETDHAVTARTGLRPLSVAADRIAHPALRWAAVAAEGRRRRLALPLEGPVADPVPEGGAARACEVYPAGTLHVWGLPHRGYKASARDPGSGVRAAILADVEARHPGVDLSAGHAAALASDDVLDAVVAALSAAWAAGGAARGPAPGRQRELAAAEGWIWLPETDGAGRSR